jgi:hypothetical protein
MRRMVAEVAQRAPRRELGNHARAELRTPVPTRRACGRGAGGRQGVRRPPTAHRRNHS